MQATQFDALCAEFAALKKVPSIGVTTEPSGFAHFAGSSGGIDFQVSHGPDAPGLVSVIAFIGSAARYGADAARELAEANAWLLTSAGHPVICRTPISHWYAVRTEWPLRGLSALVLMERIVALARAAASIRQDLEPFAVR
jgi:hypothetical protein